MLASVFPLAMYRGLGDAQTVSAVHLALGPVSLAAGPMSPFVLRRIPRRRMVIPGTMSRDAAGPIVAVVGTGAAPVALAVRTVAAVTVFLCLNA